MSVRNLHALFQPGSVAVIGAGATAAASRSPDLAGRVMRNLLTGGFTGPVMPVSTTARAVQGVLAYPTIEDLPVVPDLAVLCGPPSTTLDSLERLGRRGVPSAILVTPGHDPATVQALKQTARTYGIRCLGGASLGLASPGRGLNASLFDQPVHPGRIAFVSQSDALCTAVLDWAGPRGIGFSHFISLGTGSQTGFGDMLDYLGSDPQTRAILLYIESIDERRNFMSAARSAARNKPVLAVKAGRRAEGARAATSHTGVLAGKDQVFDAALRRAGILRVQDIEELFAAVETLGNPQRPKGRGERLAVVTNGGGIGVMAVDDLMDMGGTLAELSQETLCALDTALGRGGWSHGNPLDLGRDADASRTVKALEVLATAREVDAVLVMHAPAPFTDSCTIAERVIESAKALKTLRLSACWVGEQTAAPARALFYAAGIPTFETPHQAVRAFMHTVDHRRLQDMLMEVPPSLPSDFTPNRTMARSLLRGVLDSGRTLSTEAEAKALLAAYGIAVIETHLAQTPEDARRFAEDMGPPLVLKIVSPDIPHKSDKGGVLLNLQSPQEVEDAARRMEDRLRRLYPEARLHGFTIQRMAPRPSGLDSGVRELIVGISTDPVFGPVLLFGEGGTAVEVIADRALTLPPLNMALARDLIERTRVSRLLQGFRGSAPVDMEGLCRALIQVSQMVIDLPEIQELDINPLVATPQGVVALDARLVVAPVGGKSLGTRLAIRPYPQELEEDFTMKDGRAVHLRPIRPEDEPNHHIFLSRLTPEDIRFRFFGLVQELPHSQMARLTQIDYDREMAFIAVLPAREDRGEETLGVVRAVTDPDNETTEFSIVVRSDLKGSGLAKALMHKIIRYCQQRGTRTMVGQVLKENHRMLAFVEHLGFRRKPCAEDPDIMDVELLLQGVEGGS